LPAAVLGIATLGASVIAGATKSEQVEANVKAAAFKLTDDDLKELDRLTA